MADLTADVIHDTRPRAGRDSYTIENAVTLFRGSFVGVDAGGFLDLWADTAGHRFQGLLLDGDASAAVAAPAITGATGDTPPTEGRVDTSGVTLNAATVASVAVTDNNALVYCITDNPADLTLTPSANVGPVGWVKRFISTGIADVTLFTPEEAEASKRAFYTLLFFIDLATVTAADVVTDYIIGHAFKVVKIDIIVETAVTTASDLATFGIDIGATGTTGGLVALTSANATPKGVVVAGTAITALNIGNATDTLSVVATSVTAFAEGSVWIAVQLQNLG